MALSKSSVVQANAVSYSKMAEKLHEKIFEMKKEASLSIFDYDTSIFESSLISKKINSFHVNISFLYPLKTLKL